MIKLKNCFDITISFIHRIFYFCWPLPIITEVCKRSVSVTMLAWRTDRQTSNFYCSGNSFLLRTMSRVFETSLWKLSALERSDKTSVLLLLSLCEEILIFLHKNIWYCILEYNRWFLVFICFTVRLLEYFVFHILFFTVIL